MKYPRPFMSITELVEEVGMSRSMLKQYSRAEKFPCIRTENGGKMYVDTTRLDKFLKDATEEAVKSSKKRQNKKYRRVG